MVIFHSFLYVYQRVSLFSGAIFHGYVKLPEDIPWRIDDYIFPEKAHTESERWLGTKSLREHVGLELLFLWRKSVDGICWSPPTKIHRWHVSSNMSLQYVSKKSGHWYAMAKTISDAMAPNKNMGFPQNFMGQWRTVWSLPRPRGAPRLSGRWPRTPIRSAAFWWSCPWRIWRISQAENRMTSSLTPQFLGQFSLGKMMKNDEQWWTMRFGNLGFAGFISLALEVNETSETQTLYETLHGVDSVSTLCTACSFWEPSRDMSFLSDFTAFLKVSTFCGVFWRFLWISWRLIDIYPRRHDLERVRA